MRFLSLVWQESGGSKKPFVERSLLPHIAAAQHAYLYKKDGAYKLKRLTKWNYQIQGGMSGFKTADLGIIVIEVPFDEKLWKDMLLKLNKFYIDFMIPELLSKRIEKLFLK